MSIKDPVVIVTGAQGYIGDALVQRLRRLGATVVPVSRTDCDIRSVSEFLLQSSIEADLIFHFAAKTRLGAEKEAIQECYSTNVLGTRAICEYASLMGARLVFVSTYVYGTQEKVSASEMSRLAPSNSYGHSKVIAEDVCHLFSSKSGLDYVIVRPTNVYGPNQSSEFLIPHVISQIQSESDSIVLRNLSSIRDYIFIEDMLEGTQRIAHSGKKGETYNLGTSTATSVEQVVSAAQAVWGTDKRVLVRGAPFARVDYAVTDTRKLQQDLGWSPSISVLEGLRIIKQRAEYF